MNGFMRLDKNSVIARTASFQQCQLLNSVSSMKLARLGFLYDSDTRQIRCISCGFVYTNGSGESALTQHFVENPRCRFLTETTQLQNSQTIRKSALIRENTNIGERDQSRNFNPKVAVQINGNTNGIAPSGSRISNPEVLVAGSEAYDDTDGASASKVRVAASTRFGDPKPGGDFVVHANSVKSTTLLSDDRLLGSSRIPVKINPVTIDDRKAWHPEMSSIKQRFDSFVGKEAKFRNAPIQEFVSAGLFYVGPDDNVRCYYCDGGLKNFSPNDVPFSEHKKWFPDCEFVKAASSQVASSTLVPAALVADGAPYGGRNAACATNATSASANIFTTYANTDGNSNGASSATVGAGINRSSSTLTPAASSSQMRSTAQVTPKYVLDPRELKARLETPLVQVVFRMGFTREQVKIALQRRFAVAGDDYPSIAPLVEDLFSIAEGNGVNSSSAQLTPNSTIPSTGSYIKTAGNLSTNCQSATDITSRSPTQSISHSSSNAPQDNRSIEASHSFSNSVPSAEADTLNRSTVPASASGTLVRTAAAANPRCSALPPLMDDSPSGENLTADSACANAMVRADEAKASQDLNLTGKKKKHSKAAETVPNCDISDEEDIDQLMSVYEDLKKIRNCKVCLDVEADTVFLPCGHFVCCNTCAPQIAQCCICRSIIRGTVRAKVEG